MDTEQTNSSAIIALVLGILSLVIPWLGLILGIIGIVFYVKAKKALNVSQEKGSGIALAGLICSIIGILLQLFVIIAFVAFMFLAVSSSI
ncbi:DUF4190 domain-containing protein [Pseudogracilibacillus sp. SO30301A]|uniref:DUF4190 domain-containing protein n=1 Tax=Pseudogracilibacillus sp. SO30301A TaxID=3098291 RepID=UPI00300DEFD8